MKIAVLEDNESLMEALCEASRSLEPSAEVVGCTRWDELEPILGLLAIDLILMDMRLSECLGIELIPRIHELSPNSRIVVVSAFMDQDLLLRCLNLKIDGFLSKLAPVEQFSHGLAVVLQGQPHFDDLISSHRGPVPLNRRIGDGNAISPL